MKGELSITVGNDKGLTLCGSTRFKDDFIEDHKYLTLVGCAVISIGFFGLWRR